MSLDRMVAPSKPDGRSPDSAGDHDDDGRRPRGRRSRGLRRLSVGAVALAGLGAAVAVASSGEEGGDADEVAAETTTAAVEVRDLVVTEDYEGELGFGETDPLTAGREGVVTGVSAVGTTVGQGDVLLHLDLQPTVLLDGEVPAFRDLSVDADPGTDIAQLEQALADLGFGEGVTVDTEFTDATAAAVEEWEGSLGRSDPDGVVARGDVVFAPGDLRIAEVTAEAGTQVQAGSEVLQVTATTKVVTLQLTVDEVATVEAGAPVTIELPDRREATGSVADVATEPTESTGSTSGGDEDDEGEETFAVTVTFDDPAVADTFDSGTVDVTMETSRVEDAVAVPVTALLALREGGYAVQVVDESRPEGHRLVPVEVGTLADEWVEVDGDGIEAGVDVVVPA